MCVCMRLYVYHMSYTKFTSVCTNFHFFILVKV